MYSDYYLSIGRTSSRYNLPPNAIIDLYRHDNSFKCLMQRRFADPNGNAQFDVDFNHNNSNAAHSFPHFHDWQDRKNSITPLDKNKSYFTRDSLPLQNKLNTICHITAKERREKNGRKTQKPYHESGEKRKIEFPRVSGFV